MRNQINKILRKQSKKLLTEDYLEIQNLMNESHGDKAVVLMQIGSFYEIYESEEIGVASEVSKLLNIILTKKNKNLPEVSGKNPRLCGIPAVSLDKYLDRLVEDDWHICIVSQKEWKDVNDKMDGFYREVDKIITPGTNIDFLKNEDEHYIASLVIEENKVGQISVGLTLLESTLGTIKTFESHSILEDKSKALEEAIDILKKNNISELLVESEIKYQELEYISINPQYYERKEDPISLQNKILEETFNIKHDFLSAIEVLDLEREPLVLNSLVKLLKYVITNNELICKSLKHITKIESGELMYLGNNPMYQLDIKNPALSIDLIKVVNKGVSAIGKRYITDQLLNPLINQEKIEKRLELDIKSEDLERYRKQLRGIYDVERIKRKIEMTSLQPHELVNLYKSLISLNSISKLGKELDDMKLSLEDIFVIDKMNVTWSTFNESFTKKSKEIDIKIEEREKILDSFKFYEKLANEYQGKFKYSENEGYYIEISIKKCSSEDILEIEKEYDIEFEKKRLKSSTKLTTNSLKNASSMIARLDNEIKKLNKEYFTDFISKFDMIFLEKVITEIQEIEFNVNNIYLKDKLNFSKPEFVKSEHNFYEVEDLRHPIVESVDLEKFIPNSIQFGDKSKFKLELDLDTDDKMNGYILFGQNSSGKTVLSKSIAISIILAQGGFYVPAKTLRLSIFKSIFTRIVGNDNLEKGKSTFAIEMTELKNILKRADDKSFIVGDEISHGTETTSGLSIVAATILHLNEINSSFILSTHLHNINKVQEIEEITNVKMVHLSLKYDKLEDKIIYNRKLQNGKGMSTYGLEFAKSLDMPTTFLNKAYKIRSKVENEISGLEQLVKGKRSKYNKDVFYGVCENCGKKAEEIHHIDEQHLNKDDIHLHSKNNLKALCKKCHELEHK